MTRQTNWEVVQEDTLLAVDQQDPGITDVHSASTGTGSGRTAYKHWGVVAQPKLLVLTPISKATSFRDLRARTYILSFGLQPAIVDVNKRGPIHVAQSI